DRPGNMTATHERDGAKGTGSVASLGDFYIRVMTWVGKNTLADQFVPVVCLKDFQETSHVAGAEPCVDLRYFFLQIVFVPLRQATGDVNLVDDPLVLGIDIA